MTYNPFTEDSIKDFFNQAKVAYTTKRIFDGLFFYINNKVCCGLYHSKNKKTDVLMFRIGESVKPKVQQHKVCYLTDFKGCFVKDYIFVIPKGYALKSDLNYWLQLCLDYNFMAKASFRT